MILLAAILPLMLATTHFVETTAWWIRAAAPPGKSGLYVSKSNIFLYAGRLFNLIFGASAAFAIELGSSVDFILLILVLSTAASTFSTGALLKYRKVADSSVKLISLALVLRGVDSTAPKKQPVDLQLIFITSASTVFLCLGVGIPLILATLVPQFRLSISNVGQIINAFGTVMLLIFVDQRLFVSMDDGTIKEKVYSYTLGRLVGFGVSALTFFVLYIYGISS